MLLLVCQLLKAERLRGRQVACHCMDGQRLRAISPIRQLTKLNIA